MTDAPTDSRQRQASRAHWVGFGLVTMAYFAVTVGESILAPLFPVVADELGIDLRLAGFAFGLLTGFIAVGNFAGGYILARLGSRAGIVGSLLLTLAGSSLAAVASGRPAFLVAQGLIGLGAGVFFAPGLNAVGRLAGPRRRGMAVGIFGVAFSGGLTTAAFLAAAGDGGNWRIAFVVAAAIAGLAAAVLAFTPMPPKPDGPADGKRQRLREALGIAVVVGGVGAISQYGTVAFLPAFAVATWGMSPGRAAILLGISRIVSVPAKLVAGAAADRWGSRHAVFGLSAVLVATGTWWTLLGNATTAAWAAVLFAGTVSALFPVANLLAVEGFGQRGPLLGTFRSVQIGIGAAGAYLIGSLAESLGLGATLTIAALLPAVLFLLPRTQRTRTEAVSA